MTKRFTIDKDGITVIDNYTDGLTECKYSQEAKLLCYFLNEITEENEQLKSDVYYWKASAEDYLKLGKSLKEENEQLKKQLFEARRDYLIETADISDKLYLDDEIEKERKEIFGDME